MFTAKFRFPKIRSAKFALDVRPAKAVRTCAVSWAIYPKQNAQIAWLPKRFVMVKMLPTNHRKSLGAFFFVLPAVIGRKLQYFKLARDYTTVP
jgi:hypothetical protein